VTKPVDVFWTELPQERLKQQPVRIGALKLVREVENIILKVEECLLNANSGCYSDRFLTIIWARDLSRLVTDAEERRRVGMKGIAVRATPVYLDNALLNCVLPDMDSDFNGERGEWMERGCHVLCFLSCRQLDEALHKEGGGR